MVVPGNKLPLDHPPPRSGAIDGPGVWYGPDMTLRDDWRFALSAAHVLELKSACTQVIQAGTPLELLTKADFALPTLAPALQAIVRDVVHGRGFVLLRGFPTDGTFEETATMYWGLGLHLGSARSQNTRGHLLGHVVDISDRFENKSERGYLTARRLPFHCDSVDVVGLLCLRHAMAGGQSRIVSSYTIHNELWARRPDLAQALYGPVPRSRRDEIPAGKGPWYELPVFNWLGERLSINFLRAHIDMSQQLDSAPRLSTLLIEALDLVDELANDPQLHLEMQFEPGDIQLLHNHQILHSRTAYEDWPDDAKRRYLLRLWLAPENGIELPTAFAERYGSVSRGDRGGVRVPGMRPEVPMTAC